MATILQSKTNTATATSVTVTLDAAPAIGSILVLIADSTQGIATPSGWTQRAAFAGDQGFYIWDKTSAGAGDTATVVTPNSSATVAATVIELNGDDIVAFDTVSTVNGASAAANVPISGVTTAEPYGALLLAVGALHGWTVAPAATPAYTNGFTHLTKAVPAGTGATLVGHYIGQKTTSANGSTGGVIIDTTAVIANTAGFLIAYTRAPAMVVVPVTAVNVSTGWTATGGTALAVLTDTSDATYLTSGTAPNNLILDVQLGSLARPPGPFTVRVRAKQAGATSASIVGQLYEGATLRATSAAVTPPSAGFGSSLVTFAAADIAAIPSGSWVSGLRLVLLASAA